MVAQIEIPVCQLLPELPDSIDIPFPGGIIISQIISAIRGAPSGIDMIVNLMQQMQPALAPLAPLFTIIDTIVAVFNCIQAVPDTIGPPPDPFALAKCLEELAALIDKLLSLIPMLSLPLMIIKLIDAIIYMLESIIMQLRYLNDQILKAYAAIAKGEQIEDANLVAFGLCAQQDIETQALNIMESLAYFGKFIGIINVFMEMIGQEPLLDFSGFSGIPLSEAIDPIQDAIDVLRAARKLIPIP